jgi:hypothetical protein
LCHTNGRGSSFQVSIQAWIEAVSSGTDRWLPRFIPSRRPHQRAGPGRPPAVTDAELICLAVAQVLLGYHDEHHWLGAAPSRVGHRFPRLLSQSEYNRRLRGAADLLEATLRWLADRTPATSELLRLVAGTPVPCGASPMTARRSDLFGDAGDGRDSSHHRFYWGANLLLVVTCEGTTTGFGLANPKLAGERQALLRLLDIAANTPVAGTVLVSDKGLAGPSGSGRLGSQAPDAGAPGPQGRARPGSVPELAAAAGGGDHLDPQGSARPGPPGRPGPVGVVGPGGAAAARPQRGDLVQLEDRRHSQAVLDRLRPLTHHPSPAQKIHINDLAAA